MSDNSTEAMIQEKGLTAPRVTPDLIASKVKHETYHVFEGTMLTVCVLTLQNGFTVSGESACASPENFNEEIGRKIARENAVNKIWALEGYLLKERLHVAGGDFKERVRAENKELGLKVTKLREFTETEAFNVLEVEDQDLLKQQLSLMKDYQRTLCQRIGRFK